MERNQALATKPGVKARNDRIRATLIRTRSGTGFLVKCDGVDAWLFASKEDLLAMVNGERKSCVFSEIVDDE